ncbi:DUF4412 domain-containing protein [Tenacibaculum piscium]|uniref:DUF4412 domain-containing protein n=1 Tax=Tenacibaculum piscium TaxID=1458515 RepID=UPI001F19D8B0|nr:DUF4412 domain-containing protein [Tenacibaculum piscium]
MGKAMKLILVLFFLFNYSKADAQFWKKLIKKAEQKIEREAESRAEKRVNKKIDKTFDTAENTVDGKLKKKKNKRQTKNADNIESSQTPKGFGNIQGIMKMMKEDIPIKEKYTFNNTITVKQFGKNMPSEPVKQSLGDNAFLSETKNDKLIIDVQSNAMIIINKRKKKAQVVSLNMLKAFEGVTNSDEKFSKPIITKLSGTKIIMGYACKGTQIKDHDMIITLWHTKQVNIDSSVMFDFASKMPGATKNISKISYYKELGFVMKTSILTTKGKHQYGSEVINIDKTPFSININNYKIVKP